MRALFLADRKMFDPLVPGEVVSLYGEGGMICVRSKGGRSHRPEEFSAMGDIVLAIRVLAGALCRLAW